MNGQVTLSMYEVYNEIVRDLLKPMEGTPNGGGPSELTVNAKKWVHVKVKDTGSESGASFSKQSQLQVRRHPNDTDVNFI